MAWRFSASTGFYEYTYPFLALLTSKNALFSIISDVVM